LRFEQLSVEHGLAQETVLAIAQDKQGFIWLGTQAGLTRFDGYRTVTYKSAVSDPRSLVDNWVRVLHLDRSGQLWVGTDGGLDRYDPPPRPSPITCRANRRSAATATATCARSPTMAWRPVGGHGRRPAPL
jgi:ligand-binding sensor domain-containing protein